MSRSLTYDTTLSVGERVFVNLGYHPPMRATIIGPGHNPHLNRQVMIDNSVDVAARAGKTFVIGLCFLSRLPPLEQLAEACGASETRQLTDG